MTVKRSILLIAIAMVASIPLVVGNINTTSGDNSTAVQDDQQDFPDTPPEGLTPPEGFTPSEGFELPEGVTLPEDFATEEAAASAEISALGSVEANEVVSLYFQTSGTVEGVYTAVGDYVEAGEVLADLDSESAWNNYNQAVLRLESAQLARDDLLAPPTESEIAVAEAEVASAQAAYGEAANVVTGEQLQQTQLKIEQLEAQLNSLQVERSFMNGSEEEIALQEAKIGEATFNLEIARLQAEEEQTPDSSALWSASIRIQQAQLELEQLQAGPTQEEIDSAQLTIDRAQASLESAHTALEQTQLVAPRSGTITAVNIASGDATGITSAVMEISDLSQLQMTVPINELDIGRVMVGQEATIQLDALTGITISGTVADIGWLSETSSDGIVTYPVQVRLENIEESVRLGMTGEVVLETGSAA